jgi:CelD/BcsL family acetyltransferase involved in cellulose biosynthesis
LIAEVVEQTAALHAYAAAWDRLAVAARRPVAAPGWLLPWLEHASAGARPYVVIVREDDDVVAIAPFAVAREHGVRRLRLIAARTSFGVDVLCRPGRERDAAAHIRGVLNADAITFDGIPATSPWPALLGGRGVHAPRIAMRVAVPEVRLTPDWLATRSANFRQQMRRAWRKLNAELTTEPDVEAFARLHRARWDPRGGSGVLTPGVEAMLKATQLGPDRLRLYTLRTGDRAISSHLFLAAGGHVTYWLGGFDDAYAKQHPAQLVILRAIEDAIERGDHTLDLGAGDQPYKRRFATGETALLTAVVPLRSPRLPLVLGDVAARRLRRKVVAA